MSSILSFILQVHDSVHDFTMKPNYNEPKIYTGGVEIDQWSKLTKKEQKDALSKHWYVYYSFRDPETGYLKQQQRIKGSANGFSTRSARLKILKTIQRQLWNVLEAGYNPYLQDNSHVKKKLMGELQPIEKTKPISVKKNTKPEPIEIVKEVVAVAPQKKEKPIMTLEEAKKLVLDTKQKVLNTTSFPQYRSRINRFYKWLYENDFKESDDIKTINKKTVIQYLNIVLQNTSPRNRNNTRNDLNSFIETLIDNDVLQENFISRLKKLKSTPKRNKSYNSELLKDIKDYMDKNDPLLSLFVDFVSYGFLRPIEVCRIKIGDLNLKDKKMQIQAKNKLVKEKIIPNILFDKLPDLSDFSPEDDLFTTNQIGGQWEASEVNKRDFFSKRFKKVKDHFGLNVDYGLYSFRHTTISELYRELSKEPNMSPHAVKSKLMLITGHSSMSALESYLRDIDAQMPEDFSHLLT
ncbi:tyrosine-type recombinase/integrase [Xanthomarina sp. F2636L]|uniref:tyrosine-type recombinase/integrase n=1 Tax=Xanthomarina sp. F2636L TaxID=2996018 RepID=UPI00225E3C51|nr:site-specific integrase [Xanthomarina sp. F2636L]MCX7552112.1 site-specific integrase [Xanthomarina sp. F2636L]